MNPNPLSFSHPVLPAGIDGAAAPSPRRPTQRGEGAASPVIGFARLPARALIALIRLYQRTLSPLLPVVTMGRCACRFAPTCSSYAAEALRSHGLFAGAWLAVCRLARCTPLHPGGFDPVPAPRARPQCRSASPSSLTASVPHSL